MEGVNNSPDPQEDNFNAAPEIYITEAEVKKCDHYFIRKSTTVFGCNKCPAHWIDNNEFHFKDGKFIEFKKIAS